MKTVVDYLYVSLMVAGLLAGLFLYRAAARRFAEWFIRQPGFGKPLQEQNNHASKSE
jgi:uncharacterized membrane protein YbaN (DUF454 family)